MSYADAAETLKVPIGTVRSRLSRAREALSGHLKENAAPRARVEARARAADAMSCSSFREGWEIGGPEGHAASCPRCAEWLAGQRRAAAALAQLAGQPRQCRGAGRA